MRPPARQRALRCHARLPPLEPDPPRLGCVLALVRARCAMRVSRPPPPALSCCCCCCRRLQPRAGLNKHAAGGVALAALAHAVLVCARGERPHACMPAIQAHSRPRPQSPHTPQCLLQGPPGRARPHLLGERWVVVCVGGGGKALVAGVCCERLTRARERRDVPSPHAPVQATHDEASCYVPAVVRPSIILSHWGRMDKNHTSGTGEHPRNQRSAAAPPRACIRPLRAALRADTPFYSLLPVPPPLLCLLQPTMPTTTPTTMCTTSGSRWARSARLRGTLATTPSRCGWKGGCVRVPRGRRRMQIGRATRASTGGVPWGRERCCPWRPPSPSRLAPCRT